MAPGNHRDFKEGLSTDQFRLSRKLNGDHAKRQRAKNRLASYRRRPIIAKKFKLELTKSHKTISRHEVTSAEGFPSPVKIIQTLLAFEKDPNNFDMNVLCRHLQAAKEILAHGLENEQVILKGHGFLTRLSCMGSFLHERPDGNEATLYALQALEKMVSKANGVDDKLMVWMIQSLHKPDLKIKEIAVYIIGIVCVDNTWLAIKLLQTDYFVEGLSNMLMNPNDDEMIYQTCLLKLVARAIKVAFAASKDSEIVSSEFVLPSIVNLAALALKHLKVLWSFGESVYKNQCQVIFEILGLLDAAFQTGAPTTKALVKSVEDWSVLGAIVNTEAYCFEQQELMYLLPSVRIIANVTSVEEHSRVDNVIESGFLEFCVTFVEAGPPTKKKQEASHRELMRQVFLCLANIAASTPQQVHKLLEKIDPILGDLIEHAVFTTHRHKNPFEPALGVIVNCIAQGSDEDVLMLVRIGALKPILKYIMQGGDVDRMYQDQQLAIVALQALDCILKLFESLNGQGVDGIHDQALLEKIDWILGCENHDDLLIHSAGLVRTLLVYVNQKAVRAAKIAKRLF